MPRACARGTHTPLCSSPERAITATHRTEPHHDRALVVGAYGVVTGHVPYHSMQLIDLKIAPGTALRLGLTTRRLYIADAQTRSEIDRCTTDATRKTPPLLQAAVPEGKETALRAPMCAFGSSARRRQRLERRQRRRGSGGRCRHAGRLRKTRRLPPRRRRHDERRRWRPRRSRSGRLGRASAARWTLFGFLLA